MLLLDFLGRKAEYKKKICSEITTCSLCCSSACSLSCLFFFFPWLNVPLTQCAAGEALEQQMNWVGRALIFLDVYCLTPYWHLTAWTLQSHESHGSCIFMSIFTGNAILLLIVGVRHAQAKCGWELCLLWLTDCQDCYRESVNNIFTY